MSEERDLEKELKEETDRYHRQNQEAFDMEAEYELRRKKLREQRQAKKRKKKTETDTEGNTLTNSPGQTLKRGEQITGTTPPDTDMRTGEIIPDDTEEDEYGNPRFLESTAFETGMNLALDAKTNWLLAAPFPGARPIYAIANIGGSGIINYLSQRIRGTKFSLGELVTASGLSLVPGVTNVKSVKGIQKAVSRGAVIGGTQVTSESLIDTGEFPDAETFTAGTVMGGSLGGVFQHTANSSDDIIKFLGRIRPRLKGSKQYITPDGIPIDVDDFQPASSFAASTDNPIEKFGKKLGKQVQKAVEDNKIVQRVLGRKTDNIEVEPGFEAFALDPSSKEAQRVLLDAIARKSGYKGLADFKKNVINKYPDPLAQEQLIYKFSKEGYGVGQIEHKTAKSSKKARKAKIERQNPNASVNEINSILADKSKNTYDMDWYWDTEYIGRDGRLYTNGLGKGDRDGIFNTEITFDARRISLKNVVEGIGYGGEGKGGKALAGRAGALVEREGLPPGILVQSPNPADRIIVTIENTGSRKNIINRVGQLGNIRLRRAGDNRLLGEIGDYVDALYPKTEEARDLLIKGLEAKGITDVAAWRRDQIYKRLKAIVDGQTSLPKTKDVRMKRIKARLEKDMQELFDEFPFLRPQKQVFDEVTTGIDADQATRGQRSGPFLSKTEERQIQQSKIRRAPLPVPKEEILTQQEFDFD